MPRLTAMDEYFVHQIPEPLSSPETHHDFWRESVFFILHPRDGLGDVPILTTAHFPKAEVMDAMQLGKIGEDWIYAKHERPYGGDPHTMSVGPTHVDIVEPFRRVELRVDEHPDVPYTMNLTFTARGQAYGLRRGTIKDGHERIWDQSHLFQSGTFNGTYTRNGVTHEVVDWWGQRDHSWGIRDHSRCPLWMWFAIQCDEGMYGVWHWEYPNGARAYTDGCFAPADGSDPIPLVDFRHDDLHWIDESGAPISYGAWGAGVHGLAGHVDLTLEGGKTIGFDATGRWAFPYGPLGGGLNQMTWTNSIGQSGTAIYEVTGGNHHKFFPEPRIDASFPQSH